jgi:hypothetical protein
MTRKIESLIAFFNDKELSKLEKKRSGGWYITYISMSEGGYTVVLEKSTPAFLGVYIPPRKKLKIS